MPRSQLAINCPAPLLERLRAEAQRQQATATSLVLAWIEAGLDGRLEASSSAPSSQLEQRLDVVEQRLDVLERSPKASPIQGIADPPIEQALSPEWAIGPLPDRRLTPAEAEGLLTTPEVAQALGLASQSALTNWIARQGGNGVGAVYRGHRLRGKALLPGGQKPGWLWEPAG